MTLVFRRHVEIVLVDGDLTRAADGKHAAAHAVPHIGADRVAKAHVRKVRQKLLRVRVKHIEVRAFRSSFQHRKLPPIRRVLHGFDRLEFIGKQRF